MFMLQSNGPAFLHKRRADSVRDERYESLPLDAVPSLLGHAQGRMLGERRPGRAERVLLEEAPPHVWGRLRRWCDHPLAESPPC